MSALDVAAELPSLDAAELRRYGRHLVIPEVGPDGQRKLKAASVMLVGAGGLGSPLALYLAAAGVGRIGLVDFDRVEASNLQRQLLFGEGDIGRDKVGAAVAGPRAGDPAGTVAAAARVGPHGCERARNAARLRRDRRRLGQLRHPLSRQRRLRAARQARRVGSRAALRGAARRLLGGEGPLLT